MSTGSSSALLVTGSRRCDLALLMLLVALQLASSYRLRVYHEVTVVAVRAVYVAPDGHRHALPTPARFHRPGLAAPQAMVRRLEREIRAYSRRLAPPAGAGPGGRFEWTIRYAHNSTELDGRRVVVVGAGDRSD